MERKLMKYYRLVMFYALLFIFCNVSVAYGQATTGSISGTVKDPSDAVIVGATVVLKNPETNREFVKQTDDQGQYSLFNIPPGRYELTITYQDFKPTKIPEVSVQLGSPTQLGDISLSIDDTTDNYGTDSTEFITIVKDDPPPQPDVADTRKLEDLPFARGNGIDGFALLNPGVVDPGDVSFGNSSGISISTNGGRGRSNNFTIDGQDNNDTAITGPATSITNPDLVQEFQTITNNFSAEYGQASGSIINLVSRTGTNEFHGKLFYFHSDRKLLDTRSITEAAAGRKEANSLLKNIFGFTLGGPVKKDNLFFFTSYQGNRLAGNELVIGNFTPTLEGLQTIVLSNPVLVDTKGNIIDTLTLPIDSASANILNKLAPFNIPIGNPIISPGTNFKTNLFIASLFDKVPSLIGSIVIPGVEFARIQRELPTSFKDDFFSQRLDGAINSKLTFNSRYIYQNTENSQDIGLGVSAGFPIDVQSRNQLLASSFIYRLPKGIINDFRFNYRRSRFNFGDNSFGNVPKADQANTAPALFNVPFLGGSFGVPSGVPEGRLFNSYQFQNFLTFQKGRNNIKAGVDIRYVQTESIFLPQQNGVFDFQSFVFDPDPNENLLLLLTSFGNFFRNAAPNLSINLGDKKFNFSQTNQAYFFQNEIKVKQNFTLTLGLRYEYSSQPINQLHRITKNREKNPATAIFDQTLPLEARIVPRVDTDRNNFAPRVGFSYSPNFAPKIFGVNKTTFRGGYGISYDLAFSNILSNIQNSNPSSLFGTLSLHVPEDFSGSSVRSSARANLPKSIDPRSLQQSIVPKDFHSPYTQLFSLSVEHKITPKSTLEARYVGSFSREQFQQINANPIINRISGFAHGSPNVRLLAGRGLILSTTNGAESDYHALQLRFDTNFSDLLLGVSYTYSKQIDNASEIFGTFGGGQTSAFAQNPFDTKNGERALGAFDFRHTLVVNFIYDLPFLKNDRSSLKGKLLGGWTVTGVYSARPGQHYTPNQFLSANILSKDNQRILDQNTGLDNFSNLRPFISNPNAPANSVAVFDPIAGEYYSLNTFNTTGQLVPIDKNNVRFILNTDASSQAFGNPFGDAGRNSLQGDGVSLLNFGLLKSLSLTEQFRMQFRIEALNLFNHLNKGVPNPFVNNAGLGFADVNQSLSGQARGRSIQLGLKIIF
jgi:outer membrane receptor protein involved in Fe transport